MCIRRIALAKTVSFKTFTFLGKLLFAMGYDNFGS